MFDLPLEYLGSGTFRTVSKAATLKANANCEKGEVLRAQFTRFRSIDQNNFFHGLIDATWQSLNTEEFTDPRHLKEWLLIEAGHVQEDRIRLTMPKKHIGPVVEAMTASLRRRQTIIKVLYNEKRHELVMRYAGEWKFEKLEHDRATELTQRCVEIICNDLLPGTTPDEIFAMGKRYVGKFAPVTGKKNE